MIGHGESGFRVTHAAAGQSQTLERLRAGHFVNQVAVDVNQTGPVLIGADEVGVPDLIIKGLGAHGVSRWAVENKTET
ncbi:hypothetical protein MAIT1_03251 [Magnetofaba australis IT-1]|uniref:Uncharacterized protein n=1 Tax=Magnetofaba australis IT-1 TaxID=1434232 RepID=A0A1Y2K723_9PROT|nr:hypothetical protein MAIT1_03251 [Magnetofaba australis IT-1]